MAGPIKAVIASQFDPTGLNKAVKEFNKLGSTVKGVFGALGISVGLAALTSGLQAAGRAAADDAKSQALLANQLRNTIGASNAQIASVEASISKMQLQASVADDEIRPAFASLVRATGDVARATSLTSLALDVAAGTGKSLSTVSLALGKAVNGSTASLVKLVPSIKGAKDPMAKLAKEFDGAAKAAAETDPYQRINIIFGELQEQIGQRLLPYLNDFADYLASPEGQQNIDDFATGIGDMVTTIGDLTTGLANLKPLLDPIFGSLNTYMAMLGGNAETVAKNLIPLLGWLPGYTAGVTSRMAKNQTSASRLAGQRDPSSGGLFASLTGGTTTTSATSGAKASAKKLATDYVKEFYAGIADETAKARAKAQLINMGASEGLISSILGSSGWLKVWTDIKKKGVPALKELQTQFGKTAEGIAETADYFEKINALDAQLAEDTVAVTAEITSKYNDLIAENQRQLAEFQQLGQQTLADIKKSLEAYAKIGKTTDMGAFEAEVVSAFENVQEALKNALGNKTITQDAYNNLLQYATRENALLQKIGQQRDQIAAKRTLVEALMGDVKTAFMGFANINTQVQATSQTITETTSKMVNGLVVETRRTYEQTNAATSVADNFRTMVEKARSFVNLLKSLKSQGLNAELFKQIVDAGVDAGTATAEGILAGGPDAISEINSLFADLQTISADAAETTAVVMYNGGQDVAGGFLNGLKAEEAALAEAANMMAVTFSQTFETALVAAITAALEAAQAASKAAIASLMAQMQAELASAIAALQAEYERQKALLGKAPGAQLTNTTVADLQNKIDAATGYIVNIDKNANEAGAAAKLGTYVEQLANATGNFVETTRSMAEIQASIDAATRYITNINNDVKEAGATNKLIGYYAELASAQNAATVNNTVIVKAGVVTSGSSVGQAITTELNKYANANG